MRKQYSLTARQLKDNGIYTRELKHVTIEVTPCVEFIYGDTEEMTKVDIMVIRKNDMKDIVNSAYDVHVTDMKKVLNYFVEIYFSDNYIERHIIEFKSLDNRCIS